MDRHHGEGQRCQLRADADPYAIVRCRASQAADTKNGPHAREFHLKPQAYVIRRKTMRRRTVSWGQVALAVSLSCVASVGPAPAQERFNMAIGQRGNWDTAVVPLGQQKGIFKKHGVVIEAL